MSPLFLVSSQREARLAKTDQNRFVLCLSFLSHNRSHVVKNTTETIENHNAEKTTTNHGRDSHEDGWIFFFMLEQNN